MNKLNAALLTIVNLIGAMAIIMGLIVPFIIPSTNNAGLILGLWMVVAGFTLWYFSNKLLEKYPNEG